MTEKFEPYHCDAGYEQCEVFSLEIHRLRMALQAIAGIENRTDGGDWDEIEDARLIARDALSS